MRPAPAGGRHQGAHHLRHIAGGVLLTQRHRIRPQRDQQGVVAGEGVVEQGEASTLGQGRDTDAGHPPHVDGPQAAGQAAGLVPQPPRQRRRGKPRLRAVTRQGVQEGVGCGVVALAGSSDETGDRGEQDERRQVAVPGQLVQVPGGVDLRAQDAVDPLRCQRLDGRVVDDTGHVHHRAQRVVGGNAVQQRGGPGTIGDVTGRDLYVRAQRGQLGDQVAGARGRKALPAGQQQPPRTMPGDQMPGDQPAQPAERTGQQHRAGAVEPAGQLTRGRGGPHERGNTHRGVPHHQLDAVGGERCDERTVGRLALVTVGQHETAGVFRLRGAQQPPDRGTGQVGDRSRAGVDRAPRQHHQPGRGQRLVGQPRLRQLQRTRHRKVDVSGPERVIRRGLV